MKRNQERSKWFVYDRRTPIVSGRVAGLNLQGHTQKSFFYIREIKTTIFQLEFAISNYRWHIFKSFDELKSFHQFLRNDDALIRGKDLLQVRHFSFFNHSLNLHLLLIIYS